jgi:hypothetical protein
MSDLPAETATEPDEPGAMTVECPCGWTITGPAAPVQKTVFHHRCAHTDPTWNQREHLDPGPDQGNTR